MKRNVTNGPYLRRTSRQFTAVAPICTIWITLIALLLASPVRASATVSTTTALTLSATSATPGTAVTLSATVIDANSVAVVRGQVYFCNASVVYCKDSAILGLAQLTPAGTASIKFRPGFGSSAIKAVFLGTKTNLTSTSSASTVTISGLEPSTTSIASSGSVGLYTLTANVGGIGNAAPTGLVSFEDTNNSGATLATALLGSPIQAFSFQSQANYPTGKAPRSVAVGDFNGDGIPDVVAANASGSGDGISVLLGNGDGTFQSQQTYATGSFPGDVVVGDLNGDGNLDIVTANQVSNTLSILLGAGDGTFQAAQIYSLGSNVTYVAIGDFDHDGIPDLVIDVNNGTGKQGTISVLLGKGDGSFGPQTAYSVGAAPTGIIVADLNGDGNLDIATANYGDSSLSILLGNGDGTFGMPRAASPGEANPSSLVAGDFNGDGFADLAIGNEDPNVVENFVAIMLGNGDGTFQTATRVPTAQVPQFVSAVADFNLDGKLDIAVSNQGGTIGVLLGNGDSTFQVERVYSDANGPYPLATADFNGDGMADLVVPNVSTSTIGVWLSTVWTATASVSNIAPTGLPATHLVTANYAGDSTYLYSFSAPIGLTSGKASQTISFPPPVSTLVYGASTISLTATASSGLPVVYSATGPASVSGSTVTITGAGSVVLTASQPGNGNYAAGTPVSRTITVSKAALMVIPNNASMVYGNPLPALSAAYAGFVNGDTVSAIAGIPSLTTNGSSMSSVGTYNIAAAVGSLTSSNYLFTFGRGALSITAAVAPTPTFSLPGGTYSGTQHLSISDTVSGVSIYYTTNGTTPTTNSARYTTALNLAISQTVQAIAVFPSNYTQSPTMNAAYVIH